MFAVVDSPRGERQSIEEKTNVSCVLVGKQVPIITWLLALQDARFSSRREILEEPRSSYRESDTSILPVLNGPLQTSRLPVS